MGKVEENGDICNSVNNKGFFKKDSSMRSVVIFANAVFLIMYNEMCQYQEYLYYSVIQYFLNDQRMMLRCHAWVKDPFNAHKRLANFNVMIRNIH